MTDTPSRTLERATVALICGGVTMTLALGVRHGFGLFLQPMSLANGWGREVFGLAAALCNLVWGLTQPLSGVLADRYGAGKVMAGGALLYAVGVALMANATSPVMLVLALGVLVGLGLSGTTFNVVLSAMGRMYPVERRSKVFGLVSAAGSFGQFAVMPLALALISGVGWYWTLMVFAVCVAGILPLAAMMRDPGYVAGAVNAGPEHWRDALREAMSNRNFWLLGFGYFACGFQIVFIGTHFPAYVVDQGLGVKEGSIALALIGFFNIFGSIAAGVLGQRFSKTSLLAAAYASRGVAIALLLAFPVTPLSVYLFAIAIGMTWLSTVPLTSGVVAGIWGTRHLAMLSGTVFLFHQVGSFFGGWLGGFVFDRAGSYDLVWLVAIGLSVLAVLVNLPVDERPVRRADLAPSAG